MDDMTTLSRFGRDLALEAGQVIRQEREKGPLQRHYKAHEELVTHADIKVDRLITDAIAKRWPGHRILSEETFPERDKLLAWDSPLWIIDPIDGTVNYSHGHEMVAVSIAYAEGGRVQAGWVHNPFREECFEARRGQGALLNQSPIRVSGCESLEKALVATGFPYSREGRDPLARRLGRVLEHCRDLRRLGSAALDICWVACGRLDAYYETVSPWDFAAAWLIAREAGAWCGHFSPVPAGQPEELWGEDILICTPALRESLEAILIGD